MSEVYEYKSVEEYEYTEVPAWWRGVAMAAKMRKLEKQGWELISQSCKAYVFRRRKNK